MGFMQPHSIRLWIVIGIAEIVFGVVVFAATRYYYLGVDARGTAAATAAARIADIAWPTGAPASTAMPARSTGAGEAERAPTPAERFTTALPTDDPGVVARQADEAFGARNFERAADLYAQLLKHAPTDGEVYNNLGITLHYMGRSADALHTLAEGIAADPTHQRIWLTTGFVNAQLGRVSDARVALGNAVALDPNSDVGRSAAEMLAALP